MVGRLQRAADHQKGTDEQSQKNIESLLCAKVPASFHNHLQLLFYSAVFCIVLYHISTVSSYFCGIRQPTKSAF